MMLSQKVNNVFYCKGFTLAEILISLMIIGVIAGLVIPSLFLKWQKQSLSASVAKGYHVISKIASNLQVNSGCPSLDCGEIIDDFSLEKLVHVAKLNDAQVVRTKNWGRVMYMYCENQTCDTTKGDAFSEYIKTVDGMGILASVYTRGKDKKVFLRITLITDTNLTKEGHFYPKKGRNAFFFLISDDFHAEPAVYGSDGSSSLLSEASKSSSIDLYCNPSNATKTIVSGNNCAARIVRDGWKVNY